MTIEEGLNKGNLPPNGVRKNYYLYSIYSEEKIIGYFDYYIGFPSENTVYISILFIEQQYRDMGFGKEIIEALIKYFSDLGKTKIRLAVSLRNFSGLAFWYKNGFDKITSVKCKGNVDNDTYAVIEIERNI